MKPDNPDKWDAIYRDRHVTCPEPARVLAEYSHLLPGRGLALDLACGRGGNALLLAGSGLTAHAWDRSASALERLREFALQRKLTVETRVCDLTIERPGKNRFDVIAVSNYLDRKLTPFLYRALRRNGLLFYETFITEKVDETGPGNPAFLLQPNELLHMFHNLHILLYREEGRTGDRDRGFRNKAMLIGQRR